MRLRSLATIWMVGAGVAFGAVAGYTPGSPYALAGRRVVFTDWYYVQPGSFDWRDQDGKSVYMKGNVGPWDATHVSIEAPSGIRLLAEKPEVIGPLDIPWGTILKDGALYRGWTSKAYFESADGMNWTEKARLVFSGPKADGHVFIDPSGPAAERYKEVWTDDQLSRAEFERFRTKRPEGWEPRAVGGLAAGGKAICIRGAVSPDGVHWTTLADPLVVEYSDTLDTCYYDSALRKYVLYTRYWSVGYRAANAPPEKRQSWTHAGRRAIGRSESSDFRRFPPSEMILEPTPDMLPSESLYTNCRTTVPEAPDQFLMFPAVWNGPIDDTTRIAMASSHDGKVWNWVPGGDLLHTQTFGSWNGGCVWTRPELIELPNGDWALPYSGWDVTHKYPRGRRHVGEGYAVWPRARLVGLDAAEHGEFTLVPLMAPGRSLRINAVTLRTGWIRVEVAGRGVIGRTFADCDRIMGDHFWSPVTWNGAKDLSPTAGQPITLRFQLYQAKLFGIEFE